jgi:hypothetical protein
LLDGGGRANNFLRVFTLFSKLLHHGVPSHTREKPYRR